jgi:hypothetical protein
MAQSFSVTAHFAAPLPTGTQWKLYDESGIQSTGVTYDPTLHLTMGVETDLPDNHIYRLQLKDEDGNFIESFRVSSYTGGIVIIDNLGITKGPQQNTISPSKTSLQ